MEVTRTAALIKEYLAEHITGEDHRCPAPNCRAPWYASRTGERGRIHTAECDWLRWTDEHEALENLGDTDE